MSEAVRSESSTGRIFKNKIVPTNEQVRADSPQRSCNSLGIATILQAESPGFKTWNEKMDQ